ncbi:hypothetical protein ACQVTT_05065 [Bacillus mycoides]|uniref:hypothetical protein n=1 Tax=Bacillus mycoides TaxID=1405 RepID=UPI003D651E33
MDEKNSRIGFILSTISLIISVVGLIFGDDIMGKFSGPKLNMVSTKIDAALPSKEGIEQNVENHIPALVRVIEIKNEGSNPSKNLKLVIKADGNIYDYKINSTENYKEGKKLDEKTFEVNLDRLSSNANILIKVWMKNGDTPFKVSYADDEDSQELVDAKEGIKDSMLNYIFLAASIVSISVLVVLFMRKKSSGEIRRLTKENLRLNDIVISVSNAFVSMVEKEYQSQNAAVTEDTSTQNQEATRESTRRLQDLIDQASGGNEN